MAKQLKIEEVENFTNDDDILQVRLVKFNGKPNLDIRKYYNATQNPLADKEMKPSNKGIALGPEAFERIMEIITENDEQITAFLEGK